MSSSTSNFNENKEQVLSEKYVFHKMMLAIVLGMIAAMGLVRLILDLNDANKQGIMD